MLTQVNVVVQLFENVELYHVHRHLNMEAYEMDDLGSCLIQGDISNLEGVLINFYLP